jgi:hypothetical protein
VTMIAVTAGVETTIAAATGVGATATATTAEPADTGRIRSGSSAAGAAFAFFRHNVRTTLSGACGNGPRQALC